MFLQPFSKCSSCLTNIFFITLQPITFEPVYYATFVGNVVFIFGCHQFIFQGLATFEMNFYAIYRPHVLDCFTQAFFIWNSYMGFGLCLECSVVLPGFWCIYLQLHSSYCPVWVFACCHGLLYVCVCSSSSNLLLEQMFFALCRSVLMILNLLFMAWRLSHCKYWFV